MLLKKIYYRELVNNATKIFIVLVFILPVTELFKRLEEASSGGLPISALVAAMLYGTIASFPMILTISCFVSVALTINRYCKDQEFAMWLTSGVSIFDWLRLTSFFALPMALICAVCSLYITPWATAKKDEYVNFLTKQQTTSLISPGLFKEHGNDQVFYIKNYSFTNGYAENIFIQYKSDNATTYNIVAKSGKVINDSGLVSLVLKNGYRYELTSLNENIIMLGFGQFTASIKQNYTPLDKTIIRLASSSPQSLFYIGDNRAKAELSWRLSIAIMMFVMAIFVVPISVQTGRVQGSLVFILPPITYGIYQNLILTVNGYIGSGVLSSLSYIFVLHGVMLLLALALAYVKSLPKGYLFSKNKH